MTQPLASPVRPARPAPVLEPQLQYRGFRNTPALREYLLAARLGDEERVYVVGIPHSAFAARRVSLQDGPDICFQRLRRELTTGLPDLGPLAITDAELAEYRDA